jgi:hypothetical protein
VSGPGMSETHLSCGCIQVGTPELTLVGGGAMASARRPKSFARMPFASPLAPAESPCGYLRLVAFLFVAPSHHSLPPSARHVTVYAQGNFFPTSPSPYGGEITS